MTYFVRINDVKAIRKRLLESSRDILRMLKGYNHLLNIREEKRDIAERLRKVMKGLHYDAERLERLMPQKSLDDIKEFLPKKVSKKAGKKTAKKGAKKVKEEEAPVETKKPKDLGNETDRLESALAKIEERLSKL